MEVSMEYRVYKLKLCDIPLRKADSEYTTEAANDAWNWVLTSESPTNLAVLDSTGRPCTPPEWFTKLVNNYQPVSMKDMFIGRIA